mmetsp:Transcript_27549/g.70158  ORF Transcript_27549/g.70158 Transcript_27549/m.70158 type:complete len:243 (+) Transcript_27549:383-1111(+)
MLGSEASQATLAPQAATPASSQPARNGRVHDVHQEVGVRLAEAHGRLDAEHVAVDAALAHEDARVLHALHALGQLALGGLLCGAVLDKLHAQHEPLAAHVTDNVVLGLQRTQPRLEVAPHLLAVLLPPLLVHHAQHRAPARAAHRVAAVRVEVQPARHGGGDLGRGHHSCQGQAVADALGHGHDVGGHALVLEAPVRGACAPEPGLHLVRDADASRLPDDLVHFRQVAVRQGCSAAHALDGL